MDLFTLTFAIMLVVAQAGVVVLARGVWALAAAQPAGLTVAVGQLVAGIGLCLLLLWTLCALVANLEVVTDVLSGFTTPLAAFQSAWRPVGDVALLGGGFAALYWTTAGLSRLTQPRNHPEAVPTWKPKLATLSGYVLAVSVAGLCLEMVSRFVYGGALELLLLGVVSASASGLVLSTLAATAFAWGAHSVRHALVVIWATGVLAMGLAISATAMTLVACVWLIAAYGLY